MMITLKPKLLLDPDLTQSLEDGPSHEQYKKMKSLVRTVTTKILRPAQHKQAKVLYVLMSLDLEANHL